MSKRTYCANCASRKTYTTHYGTKTIQVKGLKLRVRLIYANCDTCGDQVDTRALTEMNDKAINEAYDKALSDMKKGYALIDNFICSTLNELQPKVDKIMLEWSKDDPTNPMTRDSLIMALEAIADSLGISHRK